MTTWVDVTARARGLSGHLLHPTDIAVLAGATDLDDLAARLAMLRSAPPPEPRASAQSLELAERRRAGAMGRLLARWCGSRRDRLAPLFEEDDIATIRAAVRAAVAGTAAVRPLPGLVPTASIPERALAQLVSSGSPPAIAALLSAWGSPYAGAVRAEGLRPQPDLLALELALARTWHARSRAVVRRAGRALRVYVERRVDVANAWTALLGAGHGDDDPMARFIEGGRHIQRDAFLQAAQAPSAEAARDVLEPLVRHTPLAAVTSPAPDREAHLRDGLAREQERMARTDPVGPASIVAFWLRLRSETSATQRIIWAVAAGAPSTLRLA